MNEAIRKRIDELMQGLGADSYKKGKNGTNMKCISPNMMTSFILAFRMLFL